MESSKGKICWSRVLKNISYFLAPILLVILILSILALVYPYGRESMKHGKTYFESVDFANLYANSIENYLYQIAMINQENDIEGLTSDDKQNYGYYNSYIVGDEYHDKDIQMYYKYYNANFCYLIIDHKNGIAYTNVENRIDTNTIESIKSYITSGNLYWKYENEEIDTSIEILKENVNEQTSIYREYLRDGEYTVYTGVLEELPYYDEYFTNYWWYTILSIVRSSAIYIIPIILVLFIIMVPMILIGIGKTRKKEGINLNFLDKWCFGIVVALALFIVIIGFGICAIGMDSLSLISIIFMGIGLSIVYMSCIMLFETVVKRLKTHTFVKTTFIYWCYEKLKQIIGNMKMTFKVGTIFAGFLIIYWILITASSESFVSFLLLMTLYAFSFLYILKRAIWFEKIKKTLEEIYKGNTSIRLNPEEFKGELKQMAIFVNDIAGGFSNAVEEKLKSERLKTELITNVSHDIKTPLTSIINYIDLLKRDGITNEKAEEYLTILDNKSQRLKKLTEDLVEASKASSGNIKLDMEKLEINELIKQVSGEFEDRFKAHDLEEIITFSQNPIYICADSRYMYRVLENMYSNVSKYALENTRVYTDIIDNGNNVIIQIKNISKDKLNITADELMQRFVRGDAARNTEGSGLGLSIATSLTELQGGKFHIYLDGDLFKITIGFEKMKIDLTENSKT